MYLRMLYRALLAGQSALLLYIFFYGPRGWHDIAQLQINIDKAQQHLDKQKILVTQLEDEEKSWHDNPFNKERIAREQLQMARTSDIVLYR